MSYPQTPNFAAPSPDRVNPPGWWTYTDLNGLVNVCQMTGSALVRRIRTVLGLSDLPVWDDDLQAGLIARARLYQASQPGAGWDQVVSATNSALASHFLDPETSLRFAVWLAIYQPAGLRFDAISISSNAIMPAWNASIPEGGGDDRLVCFDPHRERRPLSDVDYDTAASESAFGIRLHPGESLPTPSQGIASGPSGLTTGTMVVLGIAGLAAVVLIVAANRASTTRPKTKSRR